jgi:hypothetical protein
MIKKIFLLAAVGGTMLSTVSCSDNSSKDDEIIPDLIISEVMFHPVTQDSAEFIEICNTGTQAADIRNMELKGGAEFTFGADLPDLAPGSCVVLAQDFSRFANAYPEVSVLGEYSGKLSNEGDDLELETSEGSSIFKMSYNDSPPWPPLAAGHGYSLVLTDSLQSGTALGWTASSQPGGTPGTLSAEDAQTDLQVYISEILPYDSTLQGGWIEISNLSEQSQNISGWILSETRDLSKPYFIIPDETNLSAGASVLISNTELMTSADILDSALSLDIQGGSIYLFATSEGSVSGYAQGVKAPALDYGSSAALFLSSQNYSAFLPASSPTPGAAAAELSTGPLAISEIHYHPADGDFEFLEITNVSSNEVTLRDPVVQDFKWDIDGIDISFEAGDVISAGEVILLVNESDADPATFRAQKNIGESVQIFSYSGKLSNSGEDLTLEMPLHQFVDEDGDVEIYSGISDWVHYFDSEPWPLTADGDGMSLQRSAYGLGSEPANWQAAEPTPGE